MQIQKVLTPKSELSNADAHLQSPAVSASSMGAILIYVYFKDCHKSIKICKECNENGIFLKSLVYQVSDVSAEDEKENVVWQLSPQIFQGFPLKSNEIRILAGSPFLHNAI